VSRLKRCSDRMCGAEDCPTCHPGCDDIVTCSGCEAEEYLCYVDDRGWASTDDYYGLMGLCPGCKMRVTE
jgi:hypothetical protein